MATNRFRQLIKPWMLPIAMVLGMIFHNYMGDVQFIAPFFIFTMLFITFCKVKTKDLKLDLMTLYLLLVQILGGIGAYFLLKYFSEPLAQGIFICIFCPTATAAPVITGMLGGSVARVAVYSVSSNLAVALLAPAIFEYMGGESISGQISFIDGFITICTKVGPLIILPLVLAFLLKAISPRVHKAIAEKQSISFYIWALSLIIVVGRSVSFVMEEPVEAIPTMVMLAGLSLLVCILQFIIGRRIGAKFNDKVAAAQSLAQKNTVLAIWMSLNFLNPVSSVAPASYILWQNTINSAQIYFKNRKADKHSSTGA